MHGAQETNSLNVNGHEYHAQYRDARLVDWATPGLRITRLRLLSDPGYPAWDVSYCHGRIGNELVRVQLPFSDVPKRNVSRFIVQHAIRDGVYAKRLGILDAISTLI